MLKHLVLPAIALGSIPLAVITRITRAAVLDVQNEDYVRTARAKGLPPLTVESPSRIAERAAPGLDDHRLQTGLLLSGAVLTETVFAFPHGVLASRTRSSTATTRSYREASSSSRSCSSW